MKSYIIESLLYVLFLYFVIRKKIFTLEILKNCLTYNKTKITNDNLIQKIYIANNEKKNEKMKELKIKTMFFIMNYDLITNISR